MELIVLGTHAMYAGPGGATAGFLVRHDGYSVWLDLGSGTLANLQEHIEIFDVGAAVISHRHPDHLVDVFPYFYARLYAPEPPGPLPLLAPGQVFDRVRSLLSDNGGGEFASAFTAREVEPGEDLEVGPFTLRTEPMAHPVPTLGVRVEAADSALAYTADTGPTDAIRALAADADLLVSEASWQGDPSDYPPDLHLTAGQAGEEARGAGARRLLLTHIRPTLDRRRSREEAEATFGREVILAEEGMVVEVGR